MSSNNLGPNCGLCEKYVTEKQISVRCKICSSVFHIICAEIPEDAVTALKDGRLSFKCQSCIEVSGSESVLRNEIKSLNLSLSVVLNKLDELNYIKKSLSDIHDCFNTFMKEIKKDGSTSPERELESKIEELSLAEPNPTHNPSEELNINEHQYADNKKGGHLKENITYLLLDSGISANLPAEAESFDEFELWKRFLKSIFYVGKGKCLKPYEYILKDVRALKKSLGKEEGSSKSLEQASASKFKVSNRILNMWENGNDVVCLRAFHDISDNVAMTRKAAIIDALGKDNLTNCRAGSYYGDVKEWDIEEKKQLGIALLSTAMDIYRKEGGSKIVNNLE